MIGAVTERLGDAAMIDRWDVAGLALAHREVYEVSSNWKLIVENFMECYHCATIHPELTEVLPEFADGLAAQYYVGHGAEFGSEVDGFTVDGSAGAGSLPHLTPDLDRRYYAITINPTVFVNLVPDHVIVHGCSRGRQIARPWSATGSTHRTWSPPGTTCRPVSSCSTA